MTDALIDLRLAALQQEAQASPYGFASMHLDDLGLTTTVDSAGAIAALLDRVESGLGLARGTGVVRMAIPLGLSDELDTTVPTHVPVATQDEPPSIYVIEERNWAMPSTMEEYRCPCDIPELSDRGISVAYACVRDTVSRAREWYEFSRTLWVWTDGEPP